LQKQFKKDNLNNFNGCYYQNYSFPINTFPGNLTVSIDNEKLIPGEDYVISLSSPHVNKEFDIYNLSSFGSNPDTLLMVMDSIDSEGMFFN